LFKKLGLLDYAQSNDEDYKYELTMHLSREKCLKKKMMFGIKRNSIGLI
jgi:hypothetical protein